MHHVPRWSAQLAFVRRGLHTERHWPGIIRGTLLAGCWLLLGHGSAGERQSDAVYTQAELPSAFTEAEARQRTIVLVGDIMTWNRSRGLIEEHGPGYPFAATRSLLEGADLAVGNLEGPIATQAEPTDDGFHYRVPPFTLTGLTGAGFDAVGLANNHLVDCGRAGLLETLRYVEQAGLRSFGAGRNRAEAEKPLVLMVGTTRVALVGALCPETYFDNWEEAQDQADFERYGRLMDRRLAATGTEPGTVVATPEKVAELVRQAAKQADLVVACLHFGVRYCRPVTPHQRALAQAAVQAGAGLVIGHHAHLWQPVEVFQGVPILYGLGNFAFGSANRQADEGLLVRAILTGHRVEAVELFPLYTKNRDPEVNYQSKVFEEAGAREVIADLAKLSQPFAATVRFEEGRGVLRLPVP